MSETIELFGMQIARMTMRDAVGPRAQLVRRTARRSLPLHRHAERRPCRHVSASRRPARRLRRRVAGARRRLAAGGRLTLVSASRCPNAWPAATWCRSSSRRANRCACFCSVPHRAWPTSRQSGSRAIGRRSKSSAPTRRRLALKTTPRRTNASWRRSRPRLPTCLSSASALRSKNCGFTGISADWRRKWRFVPVRRSTSSPAIADARRSGCAARGSNGSTASPREPRRLAGRYARDAWEFPQLLWQEWRRLYS